MVSYTSSCSSYCAQHTLSENPHSVQTLRMLKQNPEVFLKALVHSVFSLSVGKSVLTILYRGKHSKAN